MTLPSFQPVRRDAAHRQGAETADEAVAVLLEDQGVRFVNRRSNGRRLVEVFYTPPGDEGDGGDAEAPGSGKSPAAPL